MSEAPVTRPSSWRPIALPGAPHTELYLQQWHDADAHNTFLEAVRDSADASDIVAATSTMESYINHHIADDVIWGTIDLPSAQATLGNSRLPLMPAAARSLYEAAHPSPLGVEGQGTVLDPSLRLSRELSYHDPIDESRIALPPLLCNCDFTELRQKIQHDLCPTAEHIDVVPHKLVLYRRGDFFATHVDSIEDANIIGTLAIQIPLSFPNDADAGEQAEETTGTHAKSSLDSEEGNLVFYVGRAVSPALTTDTNKDLYRSKLGHSYGRRVSQDLLRIRVNFSETLPLRENGDVPVKYAAWLGDVPHEVARVMQPYRFVMLYRLYKRGHRAQSSIPKVHKDAICRTLFQLLGPPPFVADLSRRPLLPLRVSFGEEPTTTESVDVRCIGIILRHQYPPAALRPSSLKGIDAATYHVISRHFTCELHPAVECRDDYPSQAFRFQSTDDDGRYGKLIRRIVAAKDYSPEDIESEFAFTTEVLPKYPFICAAWLQLGYGTLVGGGHIYGNVDCGTDWWYRSAVLVVTPLPSKWTRVRWLFVAGERSALSHPFRRIYAVHNIFETVLSFL